MSLLDIFRRIAIGTPGTAMPEFAEDLSAEDRWAVAAYVQAMQYGGSATAAIFAAVRRQIDSALSKRSEQIAVDAYMTFEQVETSIRAKNPGLASELEGNFAWLRTRAVKADEAERHTIRERLLAGLERAERVVADRPSAASLFVSSFFLLIREGFEAILIVPREGRRTRAAPGRGARGVDRRRSECAHVGPGRAAPAGDSGSARND